MHPLGSAGQRELEAGILVGREDGMLPTGGPDAEQLDRGEAEMVEIALAADVVAVEIQADRGGDRTRRHPGDLDRDLVPVSGPRHGSGP